MNEKAFAIANALARYYGIPEPEFTSVQECHQWIKSVLNKSNAQLRKCPFCHTVMARKLVKGKLRYVCKTCNKTFALKSKAIEGFEKYGTIDTRGSSKDFKS